MSDPSGRLTASVFNRLGRPAWWVRREGAPVPLRAILDAPGLGELSGRAPAKLEQRLVHLPAEAAAAAAGDLITQDGRTWLLGGPPDPDPSALSKNWIATELTVAASYDAAGRPLLAWDGVNWVPAA